MNAPSPYRDSFKNTRTPRPAHVPDALGALCEVLGREAAAGCPGLGLLRSGWGRGRPGELEGVKHRVVGKEVE